MPTEVMVFLSIVLTLSAFSDIKSGRIPNVVTFSSLAILLSYYSMARGLEGLIFCLQGAGTGFVLMIIPYLLGTMGAGDVKLMAAVGAGVGPEYAIFTFLAASIVGGLYAVMVLVRHPVESKLFFRRLRAGVLASRATKSFDLGVVKSEGLPKLYYGVPIAIGGVASMVHFLVTGGIF